MCSLTTEWKPLDDFYSVSNHGEIKNKFGKIKKQVYWHGNVVVQLIRGRTRSWQTTRKLVATAFLDKPEGMTILKYKDGDKFNNCVSNLYWAKPTPPSRHGIPRGEGILTSKLTENQVVSIKHLLSSGLGATHIGRLYGRPSTTIANIKSGKSWGWL